MSGLAFRPFAGRRCRGRPATRSNCCARSTLLHTPSRLRHSASNYDSQLAAGNRRRIDVGEANGERFLCIASCGFDSDANRIANETKAIGGPLVYAYAAIKALWQWRPAEFMVTVDGEATSVRGYSVAVANSQAYGGGMFVAPQARLDDGLLDVVITGDAPKRRFLTGLPQVFKGTHIERDDVITLRGRIVEVDADRPFDVYADGDVLTGLPMRVGLLDGALELIAPPAGAP